MYHFLKNKSNLPFQQGYLGVEFFFIVSGYLMTKNALTKNEDNIGIKTFDYIWKKIKAFFPYVFIAFIIGIAVDGHYNHRTISEYANLIWNFLFVDMAIVIDTYWVQGQVWYISAMLISMLILYPLIIKYKKNFIYIIAPIIVLFVGGYISHTLGNLSKTTLWTGICRIGLLRGFFELALGSILYEVSDKIKNINFNKFGKIILTIIELLGFSAVLLIVNVKSQRYDFVAVICMSISVAVAFSEKSLLLNLFNKKFIYYLEKLSFPMYLHHLWIIIIVNKSCKEMQMRVRTVIVLIATIVFSIIIMWTTEKMKGKISKRLRKLFITE